MMYCRTCGNKVNDNAEICVKCGCRPLTGRSYCQNCGAKTAEQQVMCIRCKAALKSAAEKSVQSQVAAGRRIFGKVLTVIGVILLIISIIDTVTGFLTKEIIYELVYEPELLGERLLLLLIAIVFLVVGKCLKK